MAARAPLRPVTVATPTPATQLASEHSSTIVYRPRGRRQSSHSTHRVIEGPNPTRRDRRKSAPEQTQSPPSQDRSRIRAQTFVAPGRGSHSVLRPPNPGENDVWWAMSCY